MLYLTNLALVNTMNTAASQMNHGLMMQALDFAYQKAINGMVGLDSAYTLADHYRQSNIAWDQQVNRLIRWQDAKCGVSGFVTGLGGLLAMPVTLPASLTSSLFIQIRMIAAIAILAGHDVRNDRVQTLVYACLVGHAVKDVLKSTGINIGTKLGTQMMKNVSTQTIKQINKRIGFCLLTKFGSRGVINLGKCLPLVGGIIGMSCDGISTHLIGKTAKKVFFED